MYNHEYDKDRMTTWCKKLNNDILTKIYEYDSTYREIFSNEIVKYIWKESWRIWYKNHKYTDPYIIKAIELFISLFDIQNYIIVRNIVSKAYFVSDLIIEKMIRDDNLCRISFNFTVNGIMKICAVRYDIYKCSYTMLDGSTMNIYVEYMKND
jgi:hypothetical protein